MRHPHSFIAVILLAACTEQATQVEDPAVTPSSLEEEEADIHGIDIETTRLLRLEVEPRHTVSFYELAPGTVGMIEELDPAVHQPIIDREVSIREALRMLQPAAPVPANLEAALVRAAAVPVTVSPAASEPSNGGGERYRARTSSNADGFINGGACDITLVSGETSPFAACKTNWSGSYWAQINNVQIIHGHVQSMSGAITGRVQVHSSVFDKTIASGGYAIYSFGNPTAGVRRLDVFNASGDWYHVSAKFRVCAGCSASNRWWNN